jgi:predicted peroxiredoxin
MTKQKYASIMIFHDELCQVFNGLMTAISLQRAGADVTIFFASRGINAVHKDRINDLKCLPDQPEEETAESYGPHGGNEPAHA